MQGWIHVFYRSSRVAPSVPASLYSPILKCRCTIGSLLFLDCGSLEFVGSLLFHWTTVMVSGKSGTLRGFSCREIIAGQQQYIRARHSTCGKSPDRERLHSKFFRTGACGRSVSSTVLSFFSCEESRMFVSPMPPVTTLRRHSVRRNLNHNLAKRSSAFPA